MFAFHHIFLLVDACVCAVECTGQAPAPGKQDRQNGDVSRVGMQMDVGMRSDAFTKYHPSFKLCHAFCCVVSYDGLDKDNNILAG